LRILLTGASGRIGSRLAPRLAEAGHSIRALVRSPSAELAWRRPGIDVITGDLGDDAALARAVRDVDVVVHAAAAFRGVPAAETDATNFQGTIRLADAAASTGVARFIFTSTNLVYGPGGDRPARESDRLAAEQPYPRSKAAAEAELLTRASAGDLDVRILRFAFVYGEGDPHLAESLRWVRDWPSYKRLHMVHHADVASGVLAAIDAPPSGERVFNIADDCPVTAYEIMTILGHAIPADAAQRSLDAPWESIVDTTLARTVLGFRPVHPTVHSAQAAGAL
jgi:nucleoside-diphosphate-sugar epimerase